MNVEAFVFLGIVLLVWFFASMGSWLREQLERYIQYQDDLGAHEASPSTPDFGDVQPEAVTAELPDPLPALLIVRESRKRHPRLRYRSQEAARRGIILMTVFGACKALETRDDF